MAGFVQIIEWTTTRLTDVEELQRRFGAEQEAGSVPGGPRRITVTADRDRPNTYLTIVEFDDYESAMENSARPETADFAAQLAALCEGPSTFRNLDVHSQLVR